MKNIESNLLKIEDDLQGLVIHSDFDEAIQGVDNTSEANHALLRVKFRHDILKSVPKPPIALTIGDEIWGTLGNLSIITGKAKTRKTFLSTIVMAAVAGSNSMNIECPLPDERRKVIFFDTEQSSYDVHKVVSRVKELTGISDNELMDRFRVYELRKSDSSNERLKFVENEIYHPDNNDVGIIVIDGIRDLISDINDPKESSGIALRVMKWTAERDVHITMILHTNKDGVNVRGHIGSELVNKSETTLKVSVNNSNKAISIVEPEFTRQKSFEPFAFAIDEDGLPYVTDMPLEEKKKDKRNQYPDEITNDEYANCAEDIKQFSRSQIITQVQRYFKIGRDTALTYIDYMVSMKIVSKTKVSGKHEYKYNTTY